MRMFLGMTEATKQALCIKIITKSTLLYSTSELHRIQILFLLVVQLQLIMEDMSLSIHKVMMSHS